MKSVVLLAAGSLASDTIPYWHSGDFADSFLSFLEVQCDCPIVYEPVCGADGHFYPTACFAQCKGAEVAGAASATLPKSQCLSFAPKGSHNQAAAAFLQSAEGEQKEEVVKGDTVAKIAARTGVSADQIEKFNDIEDPDDLSMWVGDSVWLTQPPKPSSNLNTPGTNHMNDRPPSPSEVTILEGSMKKPSTVDMVPGGGMQLAPEPVVPPAAVQPAPAKPAMEPAAVQPAAVEKSADHPMYVVQPGDTLQDICKKKGVQVADMKTLNHIVDETALQVGMQLQLPTVGLFVMKTTPEQAASHAATNLLMGGMGDAKSAVAGEAGAMLPGMGSTDSDGMPVPHHGHRSRDAMDDDAELTDDD